MKPEVNYSIYLVTDSKLLGTKTLVQAVEEAIKGGCTLVQLREKEMSSLDFYETALAVKSVTLKHKIPLIINDRVDIALAVNAEGVHIGQSDLPAEIVRDLIGKNKILGVSATNLVEAERAERDGADYIGVGAMFATNTKTDAKLVSIDELKNIKEKVKISVVAIGGISAENVSVFSETKIDGIAVVSAIILKDDITAATRELKDLFLNIKGE